MPSLLPAPQITSVTSDLVSVEWFQPLYNGGCSVLSFHLFFKAVTEANWTEIDPLAVTNKPYLQQYQINTSSYAVGNDY